MRRSALLAAAVLLAAPVVAPRLPAQERGAAQLAELVDGLGSSARVLVIAAHPDDEDTRLITWLQRGRHVQTAYLSLTRGDGGQNLIGNELGEALGAIRTEELLSARRIDGATQYFTRAYDFGFSKSAEETYRHWPHDSVLGDVVRVVRSFRPQVIVAVFSGTPQDGHGHHQVSGLLAREAYDASGDVARFPEATYGARWEASKFYRTRTYWRNEGATYRYDAGEYSPLLGRSYAEIAAESRSQHKSQGFGSLQPKGAMVGSLRRDASRVNAATPAASERSIFDGVDTTLRGEVPASRAAAADSASRLAARISATLDLRNPASSVGALAELCRRLATIGEAPSSQPVNGRIRIRGVDAGACGTTAGDAAAAAAVVAAAGVAIDATVDRPVVATGDSVSVDVAIFNRGKSELPVQLVGVVDRGDLAWDGASVETRRDVVASDSAMHIRVGLRRIGSATQPWWLVKPRKGDLFAVPVPGLDEATMSQRLIAIVAVQIAGTPVLVSVPVLYRAADPVKGDVSRPLAVVPAVSVTLDREADYARANAPIDRTIRVSLQSGSAAERSARVALALPAGLRADSASRTVTLAPFGVGAAEFRVRGTLAPGVHRVRATAESGGERFADGYTLVSYDHIRPQRIYRPAELQLEAVDVQLPPNRRVAYVQGVGDNGAPALRQLGFDVTMLDPASLGSADLSAYATVVIGPRAYEASPQLAAHNRRLLDWVQRGGTMVVQYGQYEMQAPGVMPYPITLARPADRVTVEGAPVRITDARSPLLAYPNRITAADFDGWVQDRTVYMPHTFDPRYHTVFSTNDPGEPPDDGPVLVTPYGRGTYVYTTFALFRQLPAGVPGAARLLVNLIAAGQAPKPVTRADVPERATAALSSGGALFGLAFASARSLAGATASGAEARR